jgi:hypothetical protein
VYQGPATITRVDGSHIRADVTIWLYEAGPLSEWGGRVVVNAPDTRLDDLGSRCGIRWATPSGGFMAGAFVLGAGHVGEQATTYRMQGSGAIAAVAADA